MFAAIFASLAFTFVVATLAAKSRKAALVIVPMLDILQSVPVLGFLTFTLTFFMGLFPTRELGVELAAIFLIFTAQAWNMAFSFYQSLRTLPGDLDEVARQFRLSPWRRFIRLELPFAAPALVWNTMMSMSGSWFFVVYSEAITVGGTTVTLPGIGSWLALAIQRRDVGAVAWAVGAMGVVIVLYDQFLFRPIVAWADKFRFEQTASQDQPRSWFFEVLRRTRVFRRLRRAVAAVLAAAPRPALPRLALPRIGGAAAARWLDRLWPWLIAGAALTGAWMVVRYVSATLGWRDALTALGLGLITLTRVLVLIALASLVWVPIGVWIGLRPAVVAAHPAGGAVPGRLSGQCPLPHRGDRHHRLAARSRRLALAPDHPGDPVVHPLQRRRRGQRPSQRPEGGRRHLPPGILAALAGFHPAGHLPLLCHRRADRLGGFVERQHRRRGGELGPHPPAGQGIGRLHRQGHRGRRLPARGAGDRRHVGLRDGDQPRPLAAAIRLRRTPSSPRLRKARAMTMTLERANETQTALVEVKGLKHVYGKGGGAGLLVLEDVNLTLKAGEIVGLLGRSGSGKSTLLRSIAGLITPTGGSIEISDMPGDDTAHGVSMVFQSFALFPWLTVLKNVELGLEAQGVPADTRRKRTLAAIDLIGLDGFENAYPKELSGGMRQRVGLARALVVQPSILLMDEPFSALDVLTAETLRTDLLDLWSEGQMPIRSILLVTHNIEEAVLMCDRILVFSSNPGRVIAEIKVDLPQPRNRLDPAFRALVDDIYARMTARPAGPPALDGASGRGAGHGPDPRLHQHPVGDDRGPGGPAPTTGSRTWPPWAGSCRWRPTNSCPSPRPCSSCASPRSPGGPSA